MLGSVPAFLLRTRAHGRVALVALVVRVGAGVPLLLIGVGKFTSYGSEVHDFRHYGVPLPHASVLLAGVIEVVGALLVLAGLATRLAAGAVALNLLVAVLTAGRVDGGFFHLVVGPTLLVAMLVLAVLGGGALSVDGRIVHRRSPAA